MSDGAVTTPYSRTLKWAIITSRILILPMVFEMLIFGWMFAVLAIEGPRAFSGFGAVIPIFCTAFGFHGAFAAACVLVGWRMHRLRGQGEVPRKSAVFGAVMGCIYFLLPTLLLLTGEPDILYFLLVVAAFTWPALLFAILCIKLRSQAPDRTPA